MNFEIPISLCDLVMAWQEMHRLSTNVYEKFQFKEKKRKEKNLKNSIFYSKSLDRYVWLTPLGGSKILVPISSWLCGPYALSRTSETVSITKYWICPSIPPLRNPQANINTFLLSLPFVDSRSNMHIKEIIVDGFKSYANRTVIEG